MSYRSILVQKTDWIVSCIHKSIDRNSNIKTKIYVNNYCEKTPEHILVELHFG